MLTSAKNLLSGLLAQVLNAAILLERQLHLRAEPHERTDERNGYANSFKERTLKTRLGTIELSVQRHWMPQWQLKEYAGSGQCDRFCSKISVLAGLPMMP